MNQAAIYVRKSKTGNKNTDDACSLIIQEQRCREYCERNDLEVIGVFADQDTTGGDNPLRERKAGGVPLLGVLAAGEAQHIVCLRIDRFHRDVVQLLIDHRAFEGEGISLHFVDQGGGSIDTTSPGGWLMLAMQGLYAEYELRMIRHRTRESVSKRKEAKLAVGPPCYGEGPEKDAQGRWEVNKRERWVIDNWIVPWWERKDFLTEIADRLSDPVLVQYPDTRTPEWIYGLGNGLPAYRDVSGSDSWYPRRVRDILKREGVYNE